jgi:hypothetical protein
MEGFLRLKGRTGTIYLEREGLLLAEQLSFSLFAIRTLPGKKRLRFLAGEPPEEVRRYGAGYPLREDILELFLGKRQVGDSGDGGEEWEDFT